MVCVHVEFMPDGSPYFARPGEVLPDRYVYVFQCCGSTKVRIGMTTRPVEKRLAELQRSCPEELQILCVFATTAPRRLEKHIQAHFAAYRIRHDWFALPDDLIARLRPESLP